MSLDLRSKSDSFSAGLAVLVFAGMLSAARAAAQTPHNDELVKRDGARLTLGGETFRYSGLVGSRNGAMPVGSVYPLLPVSSGSASLTEP